MPKLRHSSAMLHSCLSHSTTNARRCSMGEVSFQATDPPQVRTVGVTHVLGPVCHPCAQSVPFPGTHLWAENGFPVSRVCGSTVCQTPRWTSETHGHKRAAKLARGSARYGSRRTNVLEAE